ncbi:spore germination protein [Marinisporobacter balticus]|uniref:Spore germination protein KA n=1 Tax=Marinisporobacter balticus TaxID=2018667 RepID=A0A4R2KSV1_9FIRM|nr:spore germination protein [Marinisporobacter balticus]TCO77451.1 spore germination protein KA [Marinisporobacter balticus]
MKRKNKLFVEKIKTFSEGKFGVSVRKLTILNEEAFILYIQELTDGKILSDSIIKPILQNGKDTMLTIDKIFSSVIYIDDISMDDDENKIEDYILKGKSIIILSNSEKYIIANTLKIEKRAVSAPQVETTLRGPRDSFTENMDTNLSLIRYRIKDPSLRMDNFVIGRRTKTNVAVVYIEDIANKKHVDEVKKRLDEIDIDGVLESGYIQKFILNNTFDLFPQAGIVEQSDTACQNILEGKLCIIVEGSNLALVVPKTFIEFLDTGDDHYENLYLAIFSKMLRFSALGIALTLSALYVAVVSFHSDILPPQYILAIATSRVTVPFNAFLEVIAMEFITEVLREASIRLPQQVGAAISIVGAIVIGQAAVAAGLISPLMVIIASLSMMCSFVAADYTIMNPIRILKFMMIFITGIFGIFGFTLGFTFIIINLCSQTSFGIPYFAPIAPFNFQDLKNYIFSDVNLERKRPKFLNTIDKTRK